MKDWEDSYKDHKLGNGYVKSRVWMLGNTHLDTEKQQKQSNYSIKAFVIIKKTIYIMCRWISGSLKCCVDID